MEKVKFFLERYRSPRDGSFFGSLARTIEAWQRLLHRYSDRKCPPRDHQQFFRKVFREQFAFINHISVTKYNGTKPQSIGTRAKCCTTTLNTTLDRWCIMGQKRSPPIGTSLPFEPSCLLSKELSANGTNYHSMTSASSTRNTALVRRFYSA